MIIVTGEPRSGTSLTMEIVRLLGVPVWGHEQPSVVNENRNKNATPEQIEARRKRAVLMNEKFHEVGTVVMRGLSPHRMERRRANLLADDGLSEEEKTPSLKRIDSFLAEYAKNEGNAVKIIWTALGSTEDTILESSKIILVLRQPLHVCESQRSLAGQLEVPIDGVFQPPRTPLNPLPYLTHVYRFCQWLSVPKNANLNILWITYDDLCDNTEATVRTVSEFIEKGSTEEQIQAAVASVNLDKRRSVVERPDTQPDEWDLCESLYSTFLSTHSAELPLQLLEQYREEQANNPEGVRWLDEETFWQVTPSLLRSMQAKPKLKADMMESKPKREKSKALCTSCPYYNRNGELETIVLPYDLENIVRNKIDCAQMGQQTLEQCQNHWSSVRHNPAWIKRHQK